MSKGSINKYEISGLSSLNSFSISIMLGGDLEFQEFSDWREFAQEIEYALYTMLNWFSAFAGQVGPFQGATCSTIVVLIGAGSRGTSMRTGARPTEDIVVLL